MTSKEKAFDFTLGYEGGYANNPNDKGGETFRGISRNNFPKWAGWKFIDEDKARNDFPMCVNESPFLEDLVVEFYTDNFWNPIHGDELPEKMAITLFDFAVNSGVVSAIRYVQISLGVPVDGVVGPQTVKAAWDAGEAGVIKFLARRAKFLHDVMDNDPAQEVWAMNWFYRLFKLADIVLED